MIERETLLKVARDTAAQRMKARPSLISAYLTGSIAAFEPLLGEATDIDLVLIDAEHPPQAREITRLTDQVVLDIQYRHRAEYDNPRELRVHPWRGPELCEPVFLFDPSHFFELAQAAVRGQFHRADNVAARARAFSTQARDELHLGALPGMAATGPVTVAGLCRAALHAANAVLSLTGFPAGNRRLVTKLEAAAQKLKRPDLHQAFMTLWETEPAAPGGRAGNRGPLKPAQAQSWLADWSAAYKEGASERDELIHPARRSLYERGFQAQAQADRAGDGLWLMLYTWQACLKNLPTDSASADRWVAFLRHLRMGTPAEFAARVQQAQAFVTLADEAVESWAERNGA